MAITKMTALVAILMVALAVNSVAGTVLDLVLDSVVCMSLLVCRVCLKGAVRIVGRS